MIFKHIKVLLRHLLMRYLKFRVKALSDKDDIKIVIGAGNIYQKGWIRTEFEFLDITNENDWASLFRKNSISAILAEHVWEHLTEEEGLTAAKNCYKFLKKNGYLRLAIPDGYHNSEEYIDYIKPGGHGNGADDHKVMYNYISLGKMLEKAGFNVTYLEWFDENRQFNTIDWDIEQGKIRRSIRFDERNVNGSAIYTSLIVDAYK